MFLMFTLYSNASSPILMIELGMVISVRDEQHENADSPIDVTELGKFIE